MFGKKRKPKRPAPEPTLLIAIRHSEPDQLNIGLTDYGRELAEAAADTLRELVGGTDFQLVTSPATRARMTADIIGSHLGIEPVEADLERSPLSTGDLHAVLSACGLAWDKPVVAVSHEYVIQRLQVLAGAEDEPYIHFCGIRSFRLWPKDQWDTLHNPKLAYENE